MIWKTKLNNEGYIYHIKIHENKADFDSVVDLIVKISFWGLYDKHELSKI